MYSPITERERSSRWFRLSANQESLRELNSVGIDVYNETHTGPIDPILVAGHIKHCLRLFEDGVIPQPVREILVDVLKSPRGGNSFLFIFIRSGFKFLINDISE